MEFRPLRSGFFRCKKIGINGIISVDFAPFLEDGYE